MIGYGSFNCGSSNMFRASSLPSSGFDKRVPIASDWLYCVETLAGGGQIMYIDKVLAKYRRHSKSITASSSHSNEVNLSQEDHFISCLLFWRDFLSTISL